MIKLSRKSILWSIFLILILLITLVVFWKEKVILNSFLKIRYSNYKCEELTGGWWEKCKLNNMCKLEFWGHCTKNGCVETLSCIEK